MTNTVKHGEYITGAVGGIQIRLAELKVDANRTTDITDPEHLERVRILEILSNPYIDQAIRTLSNVAVQLRTAGEAIERRRAAETPEPIDWRKNGPKK